jgi:PEP-CTERM motif-containing protein
MRMGRVAILIVTTASVVFVARPLGATPITWQASGVIDELHLFPPNPATGFALGMAWSLTFNLNPSTPGTNLSGGSGTGAAYNYNGATSSTVLQLGPYTYTTTSNILPINLCCSSIPGNVQFLWVGPWQGSPNSPNLNLVAPFLIATYHDPKASSGSLPAFPTIGPAQTFFSGFHLLGLCCSNIPPVVIGSMTFQPALIPEPATLILVSAGVALAAARRRKFF